MTPTVSILGCGRAGGAVGLALARASYPVVSAWSRTPAGRRRARRLFPQAAVPADPVRAAAADLVVLGVPDDAIAALASRLAPAARRGQVFAHLSGATSIETLAPLRAAGAAVGSLHPLQTLPGAEQGAEALRGAAVAVTADPPARTVLRRAARAWGGRPFDLPDEAKPLYHAAGVFASNYLVASLWAAEVLAELAGVPDAGGALGPLAEAAVRNVLRAGPAASITGPVVRGDAGTVARHLQALPPGPLLDGYRAMASLTAWLAGRPDPVGR